MYNDHIIIIGAGPAGLMAAQQLAIKGYKVHIYEHNKAAARKFLVAGNGGFNLTHNEDIATFVTRYDAELIRKIVLEFDNTATVQWLDDIGIETFVGSSGKVFPIKSIKPIQVLKAWLDHLAKLGVVIHYEHQFIDFDEHSIFLKNNNKDLSVPYSKLILAMGGGSWKKTGSDAQWVSTLTHKKIEVKPLESANSGYNTPKIFHQLQGQYLKNIEVSFNNHKKVGEIVFTKYGIEGSPIYYLNRFTRPFGFPVTIFMDLKPNLSKDEILTDLRAATNFRAILKNKLKLSTTALNLLKTLDKETYTNPETLTQFIKRFPIPLLDYRPIDEVISTAGGVAFTALSQDLELKKFDNVYCAGEMIDWEAPTGGYLLQACFSTGYWVAKAIATKDS